MNLRKAAQQALEALEHSVKLRDCDYDAITALRAALAEPVQEPVAKVELMTTGGNAGLATRIVEIDDHLRERLRPGQLLYTAPPQRKPLTEPLSAAIESILHTDDLSEEIHQAQVNSLRAAYDAAKSKNGGRNESA